MIDNEITQKTIDFLDKIEGFILKTADRLTVGDEPTWVEELKEDAQELRELIEIAEIDKAVMKGIK